MRPSNDSAEVPGILKRISHAPRIRAGLPTLLWLLLVSCQAGTTGPDPGSITLAFSASALPSSPAAFAQGDRIELGIRANGEIVHSEVTGFSPGNVTEITVQLTPSLVGSVIEIEVTLLAGSARIFTGTGSTTVQQGAATEVELTLVPIIFEIDVDDPIAELTAIGHTEALHAVARFATGDPVTAPGLLWTSLDPSVLRVESDGTAEAIAEGEARVRVEAGAIEVEGRVVVRPRVESVEVDPGTLSLAAGESALLQALPRDRNGHLVLGRTAIWASETPAVATVDPTGQVTAGNEGDTEIRATIDGITGTALISVLRPDVASVEVEPGTAVLSVGESLSFEASVRDANGNRLDDRAVTWRSLDGQIARVEPDGTAFATGEGSTQLEAVVEGVVGSADVTVLEPPSDLVAGRPDDALREFSLFWTDNSSIETGMVVERRVDGGPWTRIAERPGNVTSHQGVAAVGTNDFRIRACVVSGCSAPSNVVRLVFVGAPPDVETLPARYVGREGSFQIWLPGRVASADPYSVYFEVARDPDDLDSCSNPELCRQTPARSGQGRSRLDEPLTDEMSEWLRSYEAYFRIVAVGEFGVSKGSVEVVFLGEFGDSPTHSIVIPALPRDLQP